MISIALRALIRNGMRSFLTTLGVIIGVGAVVAMTTIGAGAKQRIEQAFEDMGSNMLIVSPGSSRQGGVRGGAGTRTSLTWDDLEALQSELRSVRGVAPMLSRGIHLNGGGENWGTQVQGTTPEYFTLRNWTTVAGQFFSEREVKIGAKVVVLGKTVADNLFPLGDALGQMVRLDQVPFVVVGIAASKGEGGQGDQDDVAFVPVTTFQTRLSRGLSQYLAGRIYIGAVAEEATSAVQTQVETILRTRHEIFGPEPEDDFRIFNMADIKEAQQEGADVMTSLLAGIALVSLIVGGIGIMNIMLVSVTERTREIGLRMAVGARPRDLMLQFMMEAVSLSILGGVLGLGAGLGGAYLLADRFNWNVALDPNAAILALVSSGVVGVTFGLYPAVRASRLDPIQALRYE